jgi:hypothetical protein
MNGENMPNNAQSKIKKWSMNKLYNFFNSCKIMQKYCNHWTIIFSTITNTFISDIKMHEDIHKLIHLLKVE